MTNKIFIALLIEEFLNSKQWGFLSVYKGYTWCSDINMSFQNKDASGTLREIINMLKVNNMSINLSIKLEIGRIVNFNKQY